MNFIRSLLHFIVSGIFLLMIVLPALPLFFLPKKWLYQWLSLWPRFCIASLKIFIGLDYRVIGYENLPKKACVIIANHQSAWETFAFLSIFPPQVWVLKKELLYLPIFGWGLAMLRPITIDRGAKLQALKKVNEQGKDRLSKGLFVVLFPEGTRKPYGKLGAYQASACMVAKNAAVEIVPVWHNAGKFWSKDRFSKKPGTIDVVIGKTIDTQEKSSKELLTAIERWTKTQQSKHENH